MTYAHALSECRAIDATGLPVQWATLSAKEASVNFLISVPGQAHFGAVARVAKELDEAHDKCWQ